MSRRKQGNPQHLSQRELITRKCLRRKREGPEDGAPGARGWGHRAGRSRAGCRGGPRARRGSGVGPEPCGGQGGHRKVSLRPGESGRCAVRRASGSGARGAGAGRERGRAGWTRCVRARSLAGRSPLRAACVAAALVAGFGAEGEGRPGSGEKLASAWVRAEGAGGGERGALWNAGDVGRRAAAGSRSLVAAPGGAERRPRRS